MLKRLIPIRYRHTTPPPCPSTRVLILLIIPFFLALAVAPLAYSHPPTTNKRPKIGLVLAGGGALGMAHVGVLKVLDENRIPIDIITGTSMGSIVGAAYASGATVNEMEEILSKTDWDTLFDETLARQDVKYRDKYGRAGQFTGGAKIGISQSGLPSFTGVVSGQKVLPLLQRLYYRTPGDIDFDQLPIPFRAVAADIETGKAVPLRSGQLAVAARASMAVPGFFTPVELDGRALVDGGIANNLPVDIALEMGAEKLIVVDLLADLKKKDQLGGLLGISGQIISILLQQNSDLQRKNMRRGDILLEPNLKGYSATDFQKAGEIFKLGEDVARRNVINLQKFSVSPAEYAKYKQALSNRSSSSQPPIITAVRLDCDIPARYEHLRDAFSSLIGARLDTARIEKIIGDEYRFGDLSSLAYKVEKDEQGLDILTVTARKPKWYDRYLQVGFSLQDDFKGDDAYQLALATRFNELNAAGAFLDTRVDIGWRPIFELDYYQPLGENSPFFINPILTLDRYQLPVRVDKEDIAEYERNRIVGGLGFGSKLGKTGELQGGVRRGNGEFNRMIGDPSLPEGSYQIGSYFGSLSLDSRDTPDFPTLGELFMYDISYNTQQLGSSDNFTQMSGSASKPFTFGANTLLISTDYGVSLERIPAERVFVLGGLFDLSGYRPGGLTASDFVIARLGFYRKLESLGGALAKLNLFGGGSFELASVRSDVAVVEDNTAIVGGSLFVGADTPLLPVYLAAGMNNDNEAALYINVGRIFKARR
jgi:NTE family protein